MISQSGPSRLCRPLAALFLGGLLLCPGLAAAAPAHQTAQQLSLDPSAFAPASLSSSVGGGAAPVTAAYAQKNLLMPDFHSATYAAMGLKTAYAEIAVAKSAKVWIEYIGGVYGSLGGALVATLNSNVYIERHYKNVTRATCDSAYIVNCEQRLFNATFTHSNTSQKQRMLYTSMRINQCAGEVLVRSTMRGAGAGDSTLWKYANQIIGPMGQTLSRACGGSTPPADAATISVSSTLLYHIVKGNAKLTKTLKSGEYGVFMLFYKTQNASGVTPTASVTFMEGTDQVQLDRMKEAKLSDGETYFIDTQKFTSSTGKRALVANFHLALGQTTITAALNFTIKHP